MKYFSKKITLFFILIACIVTSQLTITKSDITSFVEENNLSVILMIGDGMGPEHVKFAKLVEVGENGNLSMESALLHLSVITNNSLGFITDSAAAGTALATGYKTTNGKIAYLTNGSEAKSILEIAQEMDKATGVVTTTYVQHATPACFMTHVSSRSMYNEIARQIIEESEVDVILGGGDKYFTEEQYELMETSGYAIARERDSMNAISTGKLFGIFSDSHMPYEVDRNQTTTPSLAEMTQKALELVSQDEDGFFLMVEGGRIDHAGHANNKVNVAMETIAFDQAIAVAIDYVKKHENTILIVTADHETGELLVVDHSLSSSVPISGMTHEENTTLRLERIEDITIEWGSDDHSATYVPFYGFGTAFENITSNEIIDNTQVFHLMNDYFKEKTLSIDDYTPYTVNGSLNLFVLIPSVFVIKILVNKKRKNKSN